MSSEVVTLACCFDSGYASRASVMLESAKIKSKVSIRALALDGKVSEAMGQHLKIEWTSLDSLISRNKNLRSAIQNRSWPETIFTASPSFLLQVLDSIPKDSWLVYSDVDVWFQAGIVEVLAPHSQANVVISRHRHYLWNQKRLAKYGEFNVGVLAFRNNESGRGVLENWAKSCIEWCSDFPHHGKYADQKYLESFFDWGDGVVVDERIGANFAPWNSSFTKIAQDDSQIVVGGQPLIYAHMQGLKRYKSRWQLGHLPYFAAAGARLKRILYIPYLSHLEVEQAKLGKEFNQASVRSSKRIGARMLQMLSNIFALALCQTISTRKIGRYAANRSSE